jgi:hypothetical protein
MAGFVGYYGCWCIEPVEFSASYGIGNLSFAKGEEINEK